MESGKAQTHLLDTSKNGVQLSPVAFTKVSYDRILGDNLSDY
jgi:hypothetical protein